MNWNERSLWIANQFSGRWFQFFYVQNDRRFFGKVKLTKNLNKAYSHQIKSALTVRRGGTVTVIYFEA